MLNPEMPAQELRLHMGELTDDEMRVARAAIRWANAEQDRCFYLPIKRYGWDPTAMDEAMGDPHPPEDDGMYMLAEDVLHAFAYFFKVIHDPKYGHDIEWVRANLKKWFSTGEFPEHDFASASHEALKAALTDKAAVAQLTDKLIERVADPKDPELSKLIEELEDVMATVGNKCPACDARKAMMFGALYGASHDTVEKALVKLPVTKADTPEAKEVWDGVAKVSEACPDWMKPAVTAAAREQAQRIIERVRPALKYRCPKCKTQDMKFLHIQADPRDKSDAGGRCMSCEFLGPASLFIMNREVLDP